MFALNMIYKCLISASFTNWSYHYYLQKFHDFFNLNESGDPNKDTCGILTVEGRTFPVDVFYTVR